MGIDKLLSACCGDNEMVENLMSKLPFLKKNHDDDADDVADEPVNRNNIKFAPKKKGTFSDKDMKYELTVWKDVPLKVRRAIEDLGLDEAKWDNVDEAIPPHEAEMAASHKHWDDLDEKEKKALEILGWEKDAWETKYENFSFKDLPELQKKAATEAGFTEENWDGDHWPENLDKHWDDLDAKDKQAMCVLGYCKTSWD